MAPLNIVRILKMWKNTANMISDWDSVEATSKIC